MSDTQPYYTTRRLPTGRWAVVHCVPGTDVYHADTDCPSLQAAQDTAASMEQHRECGWQIANITMDPACQTTEG